MATHIKDLFEKFFQEKESQFLAQQKIESIFIEILPEVLRKYISSWQQDKGKLFLFVDSASAQYEIFLQKQKIEESLAKEGIKEIVIKVK